jgi:acyl-CoA synthetase (AMP-forming)/AMP-acid ligase II
MSFRERCPSNGGLSCVNIRHSSNSFVCGVSEASSKHAYTYLRDGETDALTWNYGELDRRARAIAAWLQPFEHSRLSSEPTASVSGAASHLLVSCGVDRSRRQIRIVHPDSGIACAEGQVGEIWVSGPCVAQGYWQREQESRETFQASLGGTGEGPFLRTVDLGFLKDGELFVTGRLKDLIIIRGRNHYPHDIERTVEECHPGLRPGAGAAFAITEDPPFSKTFTRLSEDISPALQGPSLSAL